MEERPKKSVSVGTGSVLDGPMNRKDFRSANKAVVVMVPRGGSPNHTADVGINEMSWPPAGGKPGRIHHLKGQVADLTKWPAGLSNPGKGV